MLHQATWNVVKLTLVGRCNLTNGYGPVRGHGESVKRHGALLV